MQDWFGFWVFLLKELGSCSPEFIKLNFDMKPNGIVGEVWTIII